VRRDPLAGLIGPVGRSERRTRRARARRSWLAGYIPRPQVC